MPGGKIVVATFAVTAEPIQPWMIASTYTSDSPSLAQ